jgi:putative tributyrin esterase
MSTIERSIDSDKLGRTNNIKVFVPDTGNDSYAAVYLQHGLGDDEQTAWQRTKLADYAAHYELIIVTADAEGSWFCNDERDCSMWEDYFVFELPDFIEKEFPANPAAESRGQCGFSMGGYGAMMLALLHPDRFSAVSTHSGSFLFGHEYRKDRPERTAFMKAVAPPGGRYDLFALAGKNPFNAERAPAIRFEAGDRDHLLEHNRRFHTFLEEIGIAHSYAENSGSHLWSYVDQHLRDSLDFFSDKLSV